MAKLARAYVARHAIFRRWTDLKLTERVRESHHIFRTEGVRELINLQCDGSQAKPYQCGKSVRRS